MSVSIGHAFHVYNLEKLSLVYISPSIGPSISSIHSHKDHVYTALDNGCLVKWRRMHQAAVYGPFKPENRKEHLEIIEFMVISDLILVLCSDGYLIKI